MRILACLLPDAQSRFQAALGHRHSVTSVTSHPGLSLAIRSNSWDVFVLDPRLGRDEFFQVTLEAVDSSSVPLCLYTPPIDVIVARRIAVAASHGCTCVVVQGFDDAPASLARYLTRARELQTRVSLLAVARRHIGRLPELFQAQFVQALCGPNVPPTVNALAIQVRASRHTLDRWTRQAGMRSPKLLLDCIRLARYRDFFSVSRSGNRAVLDLAGFASARNARERCRLMLRVPLRVAATVMSTTDVASCLFAAITLPMVAPNSR